MNTFKIVLLSLLTWCLIAPLICLLVPILLLFSFYKLFLNFIVYFVHPKWIPMAGLDTHFAIEMESCLTMTDGKVLNTVGVIYELEGNIDIEVVRQHFQTRILNLRKEDGSFKYERLRKRPVKFMGHYYWGDELQSIEASKYIKEKGEWTIEDLKNWIHEDYDESCPLWEIALYKITGSTFLAFKTVHCLGDGETTRRFMRVFQESAPSNCKPDVVSNWISNREKILLFLMGPYLLLQYAYNMSFHSDPLTRAPKIADCQFSLGTIRLKSIKSVKQALGCRFNDVLTHILGNSVRRFMLETMSESELPNSIRVATAYMGPPRDDPMCNKTALKYVSRIYYQDMKNLTRSAVLYRVPIKLTSAQRRFQGQISYSRDLHKHHVQKLLYYLSSIIYILPSGFFQQSQDAQLGVCCGMTAIPEVPGNIIFGKYVIKQIYPLAGMQIKQLGFAVCTITKADLLGLAFLSNKALFPTQKDMDRIVGYFYEELDLAERLAKLKFSSESIV